MSYDIIRGVRLENQKVFIKAASNNVYPHYFSEEECPSLSKILKERGQEALDLEMLKKYESGNFQPGTKNKYSRAVEVLRHMPEYQEFDWRSDNSKWGTPENEAYQDKRKSKEFDALLLKALTTQLPKEKYIITKMADNGKAYFKYRKGSGICRWYYDKVKATIFRYKQDAEETKKWFTNSENWSVENL